MSTLAEPVTVDELGRAVAALPSAGDADREQNLSFVADAAAPERLSALLTWLLEDPDALETVARRSYRHVNHFDKIVLVDADPTRGYRLTLHLWQPPYSAAELREELIHDHRFSFWSAIVAGQLVSENFARGAGGQSFRQYRYATEGRRAISLTNFYEFVGNATLRPQPVSTHDAGEHYFLPFDRIHRVLLPVSRLTCTLVLRGPRERGCSNVYNTTYPSTDVRTANTPFSADQLAGKLSALLDAISERLS